MCFLRECLLCCKERKNFEENEDKMDDAEELLEEETKIIQQEKKEIEMAASASGLTLNV
jgi:hypothetical protein